MSQKNTTDNILFIGFLFELSEELIYFTFSDYLV
jgi:hypothetical protein